MYKQKIVCSWLAAVLCFATPLVHAQTGTTTNHFQITSGEYFVCCGIAGPLTFQLPFAQQTYVTLVIDHDQLRASMDILWEDFETVDRHLEDGRVAEGYIEFGLPGPRPTPGSGKTSIHYIVSNTAAGIRFDGAISEPQTGADIPNYFTHSNVVAIPFTPVPPPVASIRVSEVEVCWPSIFDRRYRVEFRSTLTGNWTALGDPVTGNGSTNCITDKVSPGEPRRFYRVVNAP